MTKPKSPGSGVREKKTQRCVGIAETAKFRREVLRVHCPSAGKVFINCPARVAWGGKGCGEKGESVEGHRTPPRRAAGRVHHTADVVDCSAQHAAVAVTWFLPARSLLALAPFAPVYRISPPTCFIEPACAQEDHPILILTLLYDIFHLKCPCAHPFCIPYLPF